MYFVKETFPSLSFERRFGIRTAPTRLVNLGLAERRQRTDTGNYIPVRSRASWEYRIAEKGISFLRQSPAVAESKEF